MLVCVCVFLPNNPNLIQSAGWDSETTRRVIRKMKIDRRIFSAHVWIPGVNIFTLHVLSTDNDNAQTLKTFTLMAIISFGDPPRMESFYERKDQIFVSCQTSTRTLYFLEFVGIRPVMDNHEVYKNHSYFQP